jgi:phage terminase large subunit-like protein
LKVTPGETNDISAIETDIRTDTERFNIIDVAYDAWQCAQMAKNLENDDIPCIEYRPTVANFSPPLKEIDALIRDGRFHHDGNPVLAWAVSCVRVQEDFKGNIFPRKDRDDQQQKIDPLIAGLMAVGRWMAIDGENNSEPTLYIFGSDEGEVGPKSRTVQ